jgi:hypothetical protein
MVVLSATAAEVTAESHEVRVCRLMQRHYELRSTVVVELRATAPEKQPRALLVWPFPNAQNEHNSQQYSDRNVYGCYRDFALGITVENCSLDVARWIESRYSTGYGFVVASLSGVGVHTVRWRWYGDRAFAATAEPDRDPTVAPTIKTVTLDHGVSAKWANSTGAPAQQQQVPINQDLKHGLTPKAVQCRVVDAVDDVVAAITPANNTVRSPSPTNCTIA